MPGWVQQLPLVPCDLAFCPLARCIIRPSYRAARQPRVLITYGPKTASSYSPST